MSRPTGGPVSNRTLPGRQAGLVYEATARAILAEAESALDMGTGEGGVLANLAPLPELTVAYEGWWPTVPAAQAKLGPLGVHLVVALGSADNVPGPDQRARPGLPFQAEAFDLVLNRHEAFDPVEVRRIIKPREDFSLNRSVAKRRLVPHCSACLSTSASGPPMSLLANSRPQAGDREVHEDHTAMQLSDIAALISYVRTAPWAFEDLDWDNAKPALQQLHVHPWRNLSLPSPTASGLAAR